MAQQTKSGHIHIHGRKLTKSDLISHLRRPIPNGHNHITDAKEMRRWSLHELLTNHEQAHEEGR